MKRLLVLAAGILQVPVIRKAREKGYYVIAADGDDRAVGLSMADKAIVANIMSEEEMLEVARREHIDGVIHPCSEVAMNVMGRINDELHLCGISKEMAIRATNKHLMREAFERGKAPSPKSLMTRDEEDAWRLFDEQFTTDAILKPSRNSGSRGIAKVQKGSIDKDEFLLLYRRALEESRDHSVLIEQFIEGPEFSVEAIVWQGKPHILTVTDKKTTGAPYFVELGHNQPSVYPQEIQKKLMDGAVAGIKALGLNNCACHCELKLQDDEVFLMEIGARLGGDFISTELTHLSTGVDMVAAAINVALGVEPCLEPTEEKQGVCIRYFTPKPGRLLQIQNDDVLKDEHVYSSEIYCRPGDIIPTVKSSLDRSGHIIVTDKTVQPAIERAEMLLKAVRFETC